MTSTPLRPTERVLTLAIAGLAGVQLALGLFILLAPGPFSDTIGGFGTRNDHLARDISTVYLALGVGLLVAVNRPAWRRPVLLVALVQYGLHTINHIVDAGGADPAWAGPVDIVILAAAVGMLLAAWFAEPDQTEN